MTDSQPIESEWTREYAMERVRIAFPHALPFRKSPDQVLWIVLNGDELVVKWIGGKDLTDLMTKVIPQCMDWFTQEMDESVARVVVVFPNDTLFTFLVMKGSLN